MHLAWVYIFSLCIHFARDVAFSWFSSNKMPVGSASQVLGRSEGSRVGVLFSLLQQRTRIILLKDAQQKELCSFQAGTVFCFTGKKQWWLTPSAAPGRVGDSGQAVGRQEAACGQGGDASWESQPATANSTAQTSSKWNMSSLGQISGRHQPLLMI